MSQVAVTLIFALLGVMFALLGIPLALGRIPPNRAYGFRTRKTLGDPAIWYEANRIQGNDLIIAGSAISVLTTGASFTMDGVDPSLLAGIDAVILVAGLMAVTIHGFAALKKL